MRDYVWTAICFIIFAIMMKLKVGDNAPDFEGFDQNGHTVNLADYKGKKLALYFYPKDNTPGCTAQACNLADNIQILSDNDIHIIGISVDSVQSHKKFEQKFNLPFPLIADINKEIVGKYGVWGEKNFMGRTFIGTHRTTFLINEQGIIDAIIEKVKTKQHTAQILEIWPSS